jgi:UDP-4-amino-4-deoxy-L-arabinose-oxoglutarate aminotransferase
MDPDAARAAVTRRTKAVMPVHLAGAPADLDPLLDLGVPVVEDAAHAVETVYRGRKVGSISDATAFSLYATKNVAAGEGGILTTDDDRLADAVRKLRLMRRGHGSLYDIEVAGFKANLSDVLAALALVQLDKLEEHAEIRRRHFAAYDAGIADLDGIEPVAGGGESDVHALHLYLVRIDPERAGAGRDDYQQALAAENIGTSIHFLPVHRLTYYRERFPDVRLPVAERAGAEVLSLPLSPAHSDEDIRDVVDALRRVHAAFTSGF